MTYALFDKNKPAGASNGPTVMQHVRDNLMALRDGVITGGIPGFECVASGGTEDARTECLFTGTGTNSTERIKVVIVYGTTGGALGNPQTLTFTYSSDSGATYVAIGTMTVTYSAAGYFSSYAWS